MVRTTGDSLSSIDAARGGAGCTWPWFFLLWTALPGGLHFGLKGELVVVTEGGVWSFTCCVRQEVTEACLHFQQRECYHDSLVNIFLVFNMGVQLDRLVNHECQSWNELQKCNLLRPWTCKPTEESESAADKPQGFISVPFSLAIVWRSWGGWELKINVLLFFFLLFVSTLWFKKHWESEIYLFHKQLWGQMPSLPC